jgi:RNA polymerase sigma-70 factor (ECF subfamily)
MQLLQHPSSTSELDRKTESCRVFICDTSVTAFPGETETDAFESPLEDLAVLRRIQSQAMAWLYDKYADFIYSFSLRILRDPAEAEDVLQEVFLRIWRSPDQLKIGKNLLPWIAVVSRNSSIDILRRRRPSESIEDVTRGSPPDTALQAEQNLVCEKARALIDELPREQRIVLEMVYFSGMTHSEIADRTGSPLGTVKTRIRDALKNLRKDLQPRSRASGMQSRKAQNWLHK